MRLSVIVPVYNVAEFVGECVRSVIDEADSGVELICVDDGSTDSSGDVLKAVLCDIRPDGCAMKIIRQKNAGAGAARNSALSVATGDWVMFLDGDDILAKGWLAVVRTMAERHPSAQMLGFGRTESLPVLPVVPRDSREVDVSHVVGFEAYERALWQFAYRRDMISGLEFEHIIRVDDKLFQGAALLRASRIALMDGVPVYGYRQREGSIIHTNWNHANFSAELIWRLRFIESMEAVGKTMDRRLWRFMGLCFLEYIPRHLQEVSDVALRNELKASWFDTVLKASRHGFAPWQRFAMRVLGMTRSRVAVWFFCRLPFVLKQLMGRHHPSSPRRRILFCGVGFGRGGLSRSFPAVAEILERRGYEVKVLVPHAGDAGRLCVPRHYEVGPAFRWKVSGFWTGRALRLFHLMTGGCFRFILARSVPHDAFIVYGASCCMEWCRYSKKPTWGFLHSAPMTGPVAFLRSPIVRDLRCSARCCRKLFSVSSAMKTAWNALEIDSDVMRLPSAASLSPDEHGAVRNVKTCIFVGRLSWEKGPDRLLEAFEKVQDLSLVFVGDGPMRSELERRAEAPQFCGRVTFLGWQDDPLPFVARSGLLVNASRSEGLGLSSIEALEIGTPVLATDVQGNRDALSNGRYGRLVPDSVQGLTEGLREYAADAHSCDPEIGFAAVQNELLAMSRESEKSLSEIEWIK